MMFFRKSKTTEQILSECRAHVARVGWNPVTTAGSQCNSITPLCPRGLIQFYAGEWGGHYRSAFEWPRNECAAIATKALDQAALDLGGLGESVPGPGQYAEGYARNHRDRGSGLRLFDAALTLVTQTPERIA